MYIYPIPPKHSKISMVLFSRITYIRKPTCFICSGTSHLQTSISMLYSRSMPQLSLQNFFLSPSDEFYVFLRIKFLLSRFTFSFRCSTFSSIFFLLSIFFFFSLQLKFYDQHYVYTQSGKKNS